MRTIILTCCLFAIPVLDAESAHLKQQKSLFNYTESQSLGSQLRCFYDLIVFQDGTQCCGIVESIPSLSYPFASIAIPIDQVRLVSSSPSISAAVKIFTESGQVYIAGMENEEIAFVEYSFGEATSQPSEKRSCRADTISFILLRPRESLHVDPPCPLFSVTFTGGNKIHVQLTDPSIVLIDGWNRYVISPNDLIDVFFNGGLYGRVLDKEGKESDLAMAFVKESSFTAAHPSHQEPLTFEWKDVSRIQRELQEEKNQTPDIIAQNRKAGKIGLIEAAERQHSGMSIGMVESQEEKEELEQLFHEERSLSIPTEIVFVDEEPASLLQINPDLVEREDFLAVIEDFDLEELEQQENEDDKEKNQDDSEEFIFISQGSAIKSPFFYQIEENLVPIKQVVCVKKSPAQKPPLPIAPPKQEENDGMVYVAAKNPYSRGFYIKPKKTTNREYARFVQALNYKSPTYWVQGKIPTGTEDDPVVDISYKDAFLFAVWSGKRLPRREELRLASRESSAMTDLEDELYEWTQTPSQGSCQSIPAQPPSQQKGQTPSSAGHFVYGSRREVPVHNDTHNSYTGFRLAIDAR
ncbi:MAG: SUMF1/EgtB/PvdO family nonheme iron enzyme [Waddliaceae bacterium]